MSSNHFPTKYVMVCCVPIKMRDQGVLYWLHCISVVVNIVCLKGLCLYPTFVSILPDIYLPCPQEPLAREAVGEATDEGEWGDFAESRPDFVPPPVAGVARGGRGLPFPTIPSPPGHCAIAPLTSQAESHYLCRWLPAAGLQSPATTRPNGSVVADNHHLDVGNSIQYFF